MKGYAEIRPYLTRTQPPSGEPWWIPKPGEPPLTREEFMARAKAQIPRFQSESKPVLLIDGDAMAERKRDKRIVFGEEEA